LSVSASQAAAWLTGVPAYDTEWPECQGKCIDGVCALRWDTPACCHIPQTAEFVKRGYAAAGPDDEQQDERAYEYTATAEEPSSELAATSRTKY